MSIDDETWHEISIAPWNALYEVSNQGRIRHKPRIVSVAVRKGYQSVIMSHNGVKHTIGVHRLVASAFIRPPTLGEVVNHINSDRSDNRPENLEWTTPAGNNAHTAMMGRMTRFGKHRLAKLNPPVAYEMKRDGQSHRRIAKHFGITPSAVGLFFKRERLAGRWPE
jgi:hypothetical protein